MGFFSKLKRGLKIGVKTAIPITSILSPPLSVALNVIDRVTDKAEDELGEKRGYEKALFAQDLVSQEMPVIIQTLEAAYGKELVDEEEFKLGLELLQEGQVRIKNAFGVYKRNAR